MRALRTLAWRIVAFVVSRPAVSAWIVRRAQRTPYFHLEGYMRRWWVFNPYANDTSIDDALRGRAKAWPWLPSIRVHHIQREDLAAHPHDHPWNARTILLDGWYIERREQQAPRVLRAGDTAAIAFGEYHHIERVSESGVWTLFFTWQYGGTWGFRVDGEKVPWRVYVAQHSERR